MWRKDRSAIGSADMPPLYSRTDSVQPSKNAARNIVPREAIVKIGSKARRNPAIAGQVAGPSK